MAILVSSHQFPLPDRIARDRGVRTVLFFLTGFLFWLLFALQPIQAPAQPVSREYPLKAVFMLNFGRFTDWPADAFSSPDAPFIVGILGDNPFGQTMDETMGGEKIDRHKILVEYYKNVADIKDCNMLFICQSEAGQARKILTVLKTRPVLTVADFPNAAGNGVCVQFVTQNNRIRFRINVSAVKDAHLTMSSELLRLADIVSR